MKCLSASSKDPSLGFVCYARGAAATAPEGYTTHFFCVSSFLWTTVIAFTLHRSVVHHLADVEDLHSIFHLYVWGSSLVLTVLRSVGNDHAHLSASCWSPSTSTRKIAIGMSDRADQFDARLDMKAMNRWGYYPLILIGSWAFGTINRIHDFIDPTHKIFWLSLLDMGIAALMGLFNSIAYGLNSSIRRTVYAAKALECFKNTRHITLATPLVKIIDLSED